jgi:hypothetical protein
MGIKHKEFYMKTKRFFVFGLPVVLPALGLVPAGCGMAAQSFRKY